MFEDTSRENVSNATSIWKALEEAIASISLGKTAAMDVSSVILDVLHLYTLVLCLLSECFIIQGKKGNVSALSKKLIGAQRFCGDLMRHKILSLHKILQNLSLLHLNSTTRTADTNTHNSSDN